MDYISIIHKFIDPIVSNPEAVMIRQMPSESEKDLTFVICCEAKDTGRLIGRHGVTANALREVISIAAKDNHQRVHLKFESFDKDGDLN